MQSHNMNRRQWLKSGMLFTGGITVLPGFLNNLSAHPTTSKISMAERISDESVVMSAPPELKARLFANENPFGPCEKSKKAIVEALQSSYQYPFMYTRQLSEKIKQKEGVFENQLILCAGSTPLLLAAAIYFSRNGGNIISGDPSYDDLPERAAEDFNAKWIKVPLTSDYKLDLDAMEKKIDGNTALVYICNPNNPTGTVVDAEKLRAFCERVSAKVPVFVDEAYIDYLDNPAAYSMIDCVKKGMNVIITRTFSKLHGFAGLRVGYGIGHADIMKQLSKYTTAHMCISATSANAALVSYDNTEYLQDALKKTNASKEFLYKTLKEEKYEYIPSSANFVMFPLKMEGRRFANEMMKRGVGIRDWKLNNADWCRVSIGRMDEMEAFAAAFKELS